MSESVYLLTLYSLLATVLLIFTLRYLALARQTRSRLADDDAFRKLASQSSAALADAAARLESLQAEIGLIGVRLASIEKILKDVE